jgi:hypothetical protein
MPGGRPLFIGSDEQARRWAAAGFDLDAAAARWAAFRADWARAADAAQAAGLARAHSEAEIARAAATGIGPGDPDHWRLRAFPKHLER